ncbi:hypothetical protein [Nonomuraea recticatena]|uniref:hypothetical protein n=1 Tax=Nonomuraea recticatena TaxID=46178 RepID=UPI00360C5B2B
MLFPLGSIERDDGASGHVGERGDVRAPGVEPSPADHVGEQVGLLDAVERRDLDVLEPAEAGQQRFGVFSGRVQEGARGRQG